MTTLLDRLRIVAMKLTDLDQVLAIEQASFPSPWRREHFAFEIRRNRWASNLVVKDGETVLAYACVWHLDDELKINNLAVHPGHRGKGLGNCLLEHVLADAWTRGCRAARLEVRPSNDVARRLYRHHGFFEIGRRKNYYQAEGEDAIVMEAERPADASRT